MLVLDEAHVLTGTADGRRFLERLIRMGRSMNITIVLASQLLGDLAELEELIGVRFSFRQDTDNQARANIRMHGLDDSNERLVTMLRNFTEGRCLMRGLDGRVAAVKIDVVDPEFLLAADTNPTSIDMIELERQVAT
jgi:DNA helicase HerA-like ATPase